MTISNQSSQRDTWVNAVIGAVVSVVFSFIPFSPVIGGAVAGYLEGGDRNRGLRVGGYAGAIAAIPLVLLVGAFIVLGPFGVVVAPGEAIRTLLGILLLAALAVVIGAYTIGLGAVGGYVGVILADRWNERRAARPSHSIDETSLPSEPDSTR